MEKNLQRIMKILGPLRDDRWEGITVKKIGQLEAQGLLGNLDMLFDHGATLRGLIDLVKRHKDLRATAVLASGGTVKLDGIDVHKDPCFDYWTVLEVALFACLYADEFVVSPDHLYMWFD